MMAIPAKRGQWQTITLSDGTTVRVELRGDEFSHYWQAADGTRYVQNGTVWAEANAQQLLAMKQAAMRQTAANSKRMAKKHSNKSYIGEKKD